MKKNKYVQELIFVVAGLAIIAVNFLYIAEAIPFLFPVLNVVGGVVATVPTVWLIYSRYKVNKQVEQQFIIFIRDVSDSIKSGMTLPMALTHCSKRDYLSLSKHVRRLSAQMEWGIPFKKSLSTFAKNTDSVLVRRSVATIIATYKIGGKISDTLDAVSKSLVTINKIKKERSTAVYSQIVTSYIIFFVFVGILVILQVFLIPNLTLQTGEMLTLTEQTAPVPSSEQFATAFVTFIIIQGFFAGLATGKMSEGSLAAGLKHSMFLIVIGYAMFSVALMIF